MPKYIAFLRGINVGNIRIKMTDLATAFEALGAKSVKTILQTGNVVFESAETIQTLKPVIENNLSQTFHYQAFVLLYVYEDLAEVITNCPFEPTENSHAYVLFVDNPVILEELINLSKQTQEPVIQGNGVLYWQVAKGESTDTPFAKIIAKAKYKPNTTLRNLNTLDKMLEL